MIVEVEINSYRAENEFIHETILAFQPNLFVSIRCLLGHTTGLKAHLFRRGSVEGYDKREALVRYFTGILQRNLRLKKKRFLWLAWHEFGSRKADGPLRDGGHCHLALRIPTGTIDEMGIEEVRKTLRDTVDQIKTRKDQRHGKCSWLDIAFTKHNDGKTILIDSVDAVAGYASKWEGLYSDDSPAFKSPFASDWDSIRRFRRALSLSR